MWYYITKRAGWKKKEFDANYSNLDSLAYILLKEEHLEEGKVAVSSRITLIKDKEVIISNNELWEIVKYEDSIADNELEELQGQSDDEELQKRIDEKRVLRMSMHIRH